jgi:hypothetical protein
MTARLTNGTVSVDNDMIARETKEIGSVVVQLFVNKSGLGTALVKVSLAVM